MGLDAWDVFQQCQINSISAKASSAITRADSAKESIDDKIERVDERISHLALLCRAMYEMLQERTDITDKDLVKKMEEIDLRDGKADGKMTPQIKKCPECGRTMSPKHNRCLYCGCQDVSGDPFNLVK